MIPYLHTVHYHETDKMGIAHHANYIKWMEQARIDYLRQLGFGYAELEAEGIVSPVTALSVRYASPVTFEDTVAITVCVAAYSGVQLTLCYSGTNAADGRQVFTAESSHCFLGASGRPARLAKLHPAFHAALQKEAAQCE